MTYFKIYYIIQKNLDLNKKIDEKASFIFLNVAY